MSDDIRTNGNTDNPGGVVRGWRPYLRAEQTHAQPWARRPVWTFALCTLIAAIAITLVWGVPHIERRLNGESLARLEAAGVDPSTLNLRWSYRDLKIHGELPAALNAEQLVALLRGGDNANSNLLARGIRNIEIDVEPATASTPVAVPDTLPLLGLTVVMQRNTATVDGVVETTDQRREIIDALLATGVENIHDNIEVSAINEDVDVVNAKVEVLANMVRSANIDNVARFFANLNRRSLDYHVSTLDRETAVAVEDAASVAIVNFDISGEATVAQNAMVSVDVDSDENKLTLSGQVFSDEQHRRLSFAAREATSGLKPIVDNVSVTQLAARSPGSDERIDGLAEIVAGFKKGVHGRVEMRGGELLLNASVENEAVRSSLLEVAAAARGRGITVTERIVVGSDAQLLQDPIDALQSKLDALAPRVAENIVFNSGNSKLTNDAKFTLDLVAEVLTDYPGMRVEIEGHTDNVGRASVNEDLSMKRATAVRQYLIERSVEANRLVAVGYGARNPLVSNDTSEGRRQNRRVHFHVPKSQLTEQNENRG